MAHLRLPVVAHHTYVQLIASDPLATLFAGGGRPVVHQWQISPSDCHLRVAGGPRVAFCHAKPLVDHWSDAVWELFKIDVRFKLGPASQII